MGQEQEKKIVLLDAWMREVGEAKQLAEEIEFRIRGDPPSNKMLTAARHKLMVLATKLDRLESLLLNPPAKPVLSERDLHNRKDMILDMRQQIKHMALSLCTSPRKTTAQDESTNLPQFDTEKAINHNNSGVDSFKGQNMRDKDPVPSKVTETDKQHMTVTVEEESNMQSPLLNTVDKDNDANQSSVQGVNNGFLVIGRCFDNCQSTINLFLTIVAIVALIFIIVAIVESL